jgi:hypothetical protein
MEISAETPPSSNTSWAHTRPRPAPGPDAPSVKLLKTRSQRAGLATATKRVPASIAVNVVTPPSSGTMAHRVASVSDSANPTSAANRPSPRGRTATDAKAGVDDTLPMAALWATRAPGAAGGDVVTVASRTRLVAVSFARTQAVSPTTAPPVVSWRLSGGGGTALVVVGDTKAQA